MHRKFRFFGALTVTSNESRLFYFLKENLSIFVIVFADQKRVRKRLPILQRWFMFVFAETLCYIAVRVISLQLEVFRRFFNKESKF